MDERLAAIRDQLAKIYAELRDLELDADTEGRALVAAHAADLADRLDEGVFAGFTFLEKE